MTARLILHAVHLLCTLLLATASGSQGRELLQYGWIAHPPAGDAFNSSAYQEAMTALATTILGQTQDPLAFANSMAVAVQHWYPQYFTLLCNVSSQCEPQLLGGPSDGQPAQAQLEPIFGAQYGIWTFANGSLDHCSPPMGSLSSWAFFGGKTSGEMGCQVQWG